MAMRRKYCRFWRTFLASFWWSAWRSFQPFHFCNWERNIIERSALKLQQQQGNKHMNKVCKFKLCYPREFRVSRSTKISHTFPYNLALWHMAHRSLGRLWSKQNRLTSARQNTPTKHDSSDWTDSKELVERILLTSVKVFSPRTVTGDKPAPKLSPVGRG